MCKRDVRHTCPGTRNTPGGGGRGCCCVPCRAPWWGRLVGVDHHLGPAAVDAAVVLPVLAAAEAPVDALAPDGVAEVAGLAGDPRLPSLAGRLGHGGEVRHLDRDAGEGVLSEAHVAPLSE